MSLNHSNHRIANSVPASRVARCSALWRVVILLSLSSVYLKVSLYPAESYAQAPARKPHRALSDEEIVAGIDAAVRAREDAIEGYTVTDHYLLYTGGDQNPQASKTVKVIFHRDSGKTINTVSEDGSSLLISAIIDQVLSNEIEISSPDARESVLINSKNYEMTPESGTVSMNGRECIIVDLQARRSSTSLFNGKAWVDDNNFDFVHLEGTPSEAPNVLVGDISFVRDYATVDGLNMPVHAESHASNFLLGNVVLTIDSEGYQIQHAGNARR